jgi:hypothetical protein
MFASQHGLTTQAAITHNAIDDYRDKQGLGEAFTERFGVFLFDSDVEGTH